MKECSVKGCHNAGETKGLCNRHYLATRKEYQHQYYLRKKAEKEWSTPEGRHKIYAKYDWIDRSIPATDMEHAAIGLIANIEQAKSKQGQGQKRRKASSSDSHGVGL